MLAIDGKVVHIFELMDFEKAEKLGSPALQDEQGRIYRIMEDGLVSFGDVSRNLLGLQCQHGSRYIDPTFTDHSMEQYRHPNLAVGLRVNTDDAGGNYHAFGIHPDDIDEFVGRYHAYQAYQRGFVEDGEGIRELSRKERRRLEKYLREVGALDA